MGEDRLPTLIEQKELIAIETDRPLVPGETWYLVDAKWMRTLNDFLGVTATTCKNMSFHPGPIDNSSLLTAENALKRGLEDGVDYELVHEALWNDLVDWYGISSEESIIARKAVQIAPNYVIVELYPVKIRASTDFSMKQSVELTYSRTTVVKCVEDELRCKFCIGKNMETRLWFSTPGTSPELVDINKTLSDVGVVEEGNNVVIEAKSPNASWNEKGKETSNKKFLSNENDLSVYSNPNKVSRIATAHQPGVCGLSNLGNTCFMNAVLQCMSNCPPITDYFLAQRHLDELNKVNPLGMRGEMALAFGSLIGSMWSGNHGSTSPIHFKVQLGRFNPVFSGCQQHDSQELLTFLLDGLHEDLNRIKQKPYTQIGDDSDREDKILAQEAWDRHRKRNDSIIVDTFHGLLKSRVVCPDCKKLSVTFDPFCNLSLPLPQKKDRFINIVCIPFDGSKAIFKTKVSVPRQGIVLDLCTVVGRQIAADPNTLLVVEMFHSHFHKCYSMEDSLDNILDQDRIFVFEIPTPIDDSVENKPLLLPVCLWEINENSERFDNNQFFGIPFFIVVPREPISESELRIKLLEKMLQRFSIPALNGCVLLDNDNGCYELVNKVMQGVWFRMYFKDATSRAAPTLVDFRKHSHDLRELLDLEEESDSFFSGRNILILGFTKELKRDVYIEKRIDQTQDKSYSYRQTSRESQRISVDDCLTLFTTCEKLGADDAWYCPQCKKHQRATKKFDLWDLPKILIIHLKRFSYTRLLRDKIDAMVECPIKNLDMSQYLIKRDRPRSVYNLIGVVNHYGGMGGGHYTASCKNKDVNEWFHFDDNLVQPISEDRVLTSAAYVLFYMATEA